jgi:hypothetical protein
MKPTFSSGARAGHSRNKGPEWSRLGKEGFRFAGTNAAKNRVQAVLPSWTSTALYFCEQKPKFPDRPHACFIDVTKLILGEKTGFAHEVFGSFQIRFGRPNIFPASSRQL